MHRIILLRFPYKDLTPWFDCKFGQESLFFWGSLFLSIFCPDLTISPIKMDFKGGESMPLGVKESKGGKKMVRINLLPERSEAAIWRKLERAVWIFWFLLPFATFCKTIYEMSRKDAKLAKANRIPPEDFPGRYGFNTQVYLCVLCGFAWNWPLNLGGLSGWRSLCSEYKGHAKAQRAQRQTITIKHVLSFSRPKILSVLGGFAWGNLRGIPGAWRESSAPVSV